MDYNLSSSLMIPVLCLLQMNQTAVENAALRKRVAKSETECRNGKELITAVQRKLSEFRSQNQYLQGRVLNLEQSLTQVCCSLSCDYQACHIHTSLLSSTSKAPGLYPSDTIPLRCQRQCQWLLSKLLLFVCCISDALIWSLLS